LKTKKNQQKGETGKTGRSKSGAWQRALSKSWLLLRAIPPAQAELIASGAM